MICKANYTTDAEDEELKKVIEFATMLATALDYK